jgi:hypothetical protein
VFGVAEVQEQVDVFGFFDIIADVHGDSFLMLSRFGVLWRPCVCHL